MKKPGWPNITVVSALARFCHDVSGPAGADGHILVGAVISSQKLRKRSARYSGALPAIIAALIPPMEIPATSRVDTRTMLMLRTRQPGSCRARRHPVGPSQPSYHTMPGAAGFHWSSGDLRKKLFSLLKTSMLCITTKLTVNGVWSWSAANEILCQHHKQTHAPQQS